MMKNVMLLERIDAIAQRALDESEAQGMAIGIATGDGDAHHPHLRLRESRCRDSRRERNPVRDRLDQQELPRHRLHATRGGGQDRSPCPGDRLSYPGFPSVPSMRRSPRTICCATRPGLPTGFAHRPDGLFELWELRNVRAGAPGELWHYSDVGYSLLGRAG